MIMITPQEQFKSIPNPVPNLSAAARNEALDARAAYSPYNSRYTPLTTFDSSTAASRDLTPVADEGDRLDPNLRSALCVAVDRLTPKERLVTERYYWAGLNTSEVAIKLNMSLTATTSTRARGLNNLRALFSRTKKAAFNAITTCDKHHGGHLNYYSAPYFLC